MTLIRWSKDGWIESFVVNRSSIAGNTVTNTNLTLERPGKFVGCSLGMDVGLIDEVQQSNIALTMKNLSNGDLTYGLEITGVKIGRANNNAVAVLIGAKVLVYMTK